ncbi:MAG: sulfite exporter TauE/SafE family protein [Candidatus Dojkabacteria bacterium]
MNKILTNQKKEFYVDGMHCAACELLIEKRISKVNGVKNVNAKLNEGKVYIESVRGLTATELSKLVEKDGYRILDKKHKKIKNKTNLIKAFFVALVFFSLFLLLQKLGIIDLASGNGQVTLPFVFLVGIIASLSTCMAVVGGLVLSLSSNYAKEHQAKPMILFHASRIIGFFILGGVIGLIGSAFILTPIMSFILNLALFFVMLIMAINLLDIFPFVRKLQLKMPKFIGRRALNVGESNNNLTPILLGAATFFLPCGFTQSMQLYSLTTGSFLTGAITMLVFALGTFPVLALISFASTKLSKGLQSELFFKVAGFIIIFFAIFNFLGALTAVGLISPIFNI